MRGAAPACPTTSAMFWESEEDTAADRAGPEGTHGARREQNLPNALWFSRSWTKLQNPAVTVWSGGSAAALFR